MFINELPLNTSLQLICIIGADKMEFETTTIQLDDKIAKDVKKITHSNHMVATNLITKDEKAISFPSNFIYKIICVVESQPMIFNGVSVRIVYLDAEHKQKAHLFVCNNESKAYNRRSEFRVWVGCDGVMQIGAHRKTIQVIIKDVASKGIGVVYMKKPDEELNLNVGDIVHINFYDKDKDISFNVGAAINRIQDVEMNKILFGCQLVVPNAKLAKYTNEKQREKLKQNRTEKTLPPDSEKN